MTVPRSAGHLRTHHGLRPSAHHRGRRAGVPGEPWFRFGHGLGYTTFAYRSLRVKEVVPLGEPVAATVELENVGDRAGEEVVLLYLEDLYASVTRPARELKAFRRVALEPGQRAAVEFLLWPEALALLDAALAPRIEPGEFRVVVGEEALSARFRVEARRPGEPGRAADQL